MYLFLLTDTSVYDIVMPDTKVTKGGESMGNKRVGIEFPEDIWKEARKKCIDEDLSFADYIRKLVKADLDDEEQKKSTCS